MLLAAIAIAGTTTTRRPALPPLAVRAFGTAPAVVPRKAPAGTREPASRSRSRGLGSVAGNGGGGSDDAGPNAPAPASALGEVVEAVLTSASVAAAAGGDNSNDNKSSNDNNNNNSREEVSASVRGLLGSTLRRAYSTTATVSDARDNAERSGGGSSSTALGSDAPRSRYSNTTDTSKQRQQSYPHHARKGGSKTARRYEFPFATAYKNHPALNNVALAHALWASVIRPGVDSAIDATCGNGNDSVVLAEILFGANAGGNDGDAGTGRSELLCLDVQELACQRTREALREALPASVRVLGAGEQTAMGGSGNLVRVLEASHETLPRPSDPSSVGLVVYNLGWLPGGDTGGKGTVTQAGTTLASMVDAVSLLRVGGMLSAITYPTTSPGEAEAVRLFVTCLALLSSKTRSWEEEVAAFGDDRNREQGEGVAIKDLVASCMERVVASGPGTWRVSQHDKLGMESPPVLFTATRIK
ncbi:unnamed protein product [Pseudo-nitzschia multistriata]|uniref:Methyltransferase domain-containing protein n=1 Tax=Pseudo-nitzschia multistriata TaxID=183589 RepID=A0A448ZQX6_9STRA|nr:unnamed protein product [Pseudo-nitzschia multistriata]